MRVGIIGHKLLQPQDKSIIQSKMAKYVMDPEVEELVFPTISGACEEALAVSLRLRPAGIQRPILSAVLPGRADQWPPWRVEALPQLLAKADRSIELNNPMDFYVWNRSLELCFEAVINYIHHEKGQMVVFWNGEHFTDMAEPVRYIKQHGVLWESAAVLGE